MNLIDFGGHFIQPHKMLTKNNNNHRMFCFLLSGTAAAWTRQLIGARDNMSDIVFFVNALVYSENLRIFFAVTKNV